MRTTTFISPKSEEIISLTFKDRELNHKMVILGKRLNLNISELATMLCKEIIDDKIAESERSEYEMLNEEAKVDEILRLKRELEIVKSNIRGGEEK